MTAKTACHIVLLGNFPPRRCGIATFTHDVFRALQAAYPEAVIEAVAMTDPGVVHDYPPEVAFDVRQNERADYAAAARRINALNPDVVCVQHEYGIFGGDAGDYLLDLLDAVDCPVVTTLHTVLTAPDLHQRRVLLRLAQRSSRLIVMAQKGREILRATYGVADGKIAVIPHGAPDRPLIESAIAKPRFGLEGRSVLLTFGLLSPNKGLEAVIRALPAIAAAHRDVLYLILGSTHPHLVAREGEAYRDSLKALAAELGVADHVRFVETYVGDEDLFDYLAACDVYVTPYLNEAQITSGTLTYAVALGRPVVSTPYWHAKELLSDDRGVLVPFGDSPAIAEACIGLLGDPVRRSRISANAYAAGRGMLWSSLAQAYMALFEDASRGALVNLRSPPRRELPEPSLAGVGRLTDDCGIIQHTVLGVPDRLHGYCLDDNARALMLLHRLGGAGFASAHVDGLATTYCAFVQHAWNDGEGTFRNFMGYDRAWREESGSDDSFGRGFWAACSTAAHAARNDLKVWGSGLADRILPHAETKRSLRTQAFIMLGLCELLTAHPGHSRARAALGEFADAFEGRLAERADARWVWFEDVLSYDNARLTEALILAGRALGRPAAVASGLRALDWLCDMQTAPDGHFRPIGTGSFGVYRDAPEAFDQQPLEASAAVDACAAAYEVTGDRRWLGEARRAYDWYFGVNDLGLRLAQPEAGLCYDGLTPHSVNLNQGAESVLAFQWATCAIHRLAVALAADVLAPEPVGEANQASCV